VELTKVEITDFKSVRRSNPIDIGDVTCLVGKNESGKTTLLQALYRLYPIVPDDGKFDVTNDYPRSDLEDYRQQVEAGEIDSGIVVTAKYTLAQQEVDEVESCHGSGIFQSHTLTLSKGYDNQLHFHLSINEDVAVTKWIEESDLPETLKKEAAACYTLHDLITFLDLKSEEYASAFRDAQQQAQAMPDGELKQKSLAEANELAAPPSLAKLKSQAVPILKQGLLMYIWDNFVKRHVPRFLYFDEYYQMTGQVNIDELRKRQTGQRLEPSDRPMLGLIEMARLNIDQLMSQDRTEPFVASLEGASNHLSKHILKYWSQNRHLQVQFDVRPARPNDPHGMTNGNNLWGRVYDTVHRVSTPLGTRSRGFIWFFSFLAWFSQQKKRGEPIILLLDEPGLSLHASAQGDLLRYIEEELKPHHQVIYTTHSPFMIDPRQFNRVRIVEDRSVDANQELPIEVAGTKVFDEVLEAAEGSLFPLQGALGYDISQSLFVGPNSLIVEGVSDLLYLQVISDVLRDNHRTVLSDDWTITPVGGSDKVPTFVALLGSQKNMTLATLIDIQEKDRQKVEHLYKRKLLKKKNVLTFGSFTGRDEADIEDMFDVAFYLKLVNAEYAVAMKKPITETDLPATNQRVLIRLEEYFEENPLTKDSFNHYRPARYFVENAATLKGELSKQTLDRFEDAARTLNALL
jgi:predicted ATPase